MPGSPAIGRDRDPAVVPVPTREGWATLALAGFLFLLAANLMAGWLFFLVALIAGLLVVGVASAACAVRCVHVMVGVPPPAVEGAGAFVPIIVEGVSPARFLRVEIAVGGRAGIAFLPAVARGERREVTVRLPALPRGVYAVERVHVVSPGLVGMARARRDLRADAEVVVRPRARLLAALPQTPAGDGVVPAARRRGGDELFGVREYRPGDPAGLVHWRSTARHGRLMVREFEQTAAPALAVVVDTDRRQTRAGLDAAARAAASLLRTAFEGGRQPALLALVDGRAVLVRESWERAWDALARTNADGPPLAEALGRLAPLLPPGAGLVAVSSVPTARAYGAAVLVGPAGSGTAWQYTEDGRVWPAS